MITGLEKLYWMRKLISVVSFFCISVLLLTTFRLFKGGYFGWTISTIFTGLSVRASRIWSVTSWIHFPPIFGRLAWCAIGCC